MYDVNSSSVQSTKLKSSLATNFSNYTTHSRPQRSRNTSGCSATVSSNLVSKHQQPNLSSDHQPPPTTTNDNLNNWTFPEFELIQKHEPRCPHIKRIDRNVPIGYGFILALSHNSPSLVKGLQEDSTSPYSLQSPPHSPYKHSFKSTRHKSLICLDCCSTFDTVDELDYKIKNYHTVNNISSERYGSTEPCPGVLFLEKQTLGIYCAQCERFLLNDNKQDDFKLIRDLARTNLLLRPSLNTITLHKWSVCYQRRTLLRKTIAAWRNSKKIATAANKRPDKTTSPTNQTDNTHHHLNITTTTATTTTTTTRRQTNHNTKHSQPHKIFDYKKVNNRKLPTTTTTDERPLRAPLRSTRKIHPPPKTIPPPSFGPLNIKSQRGLKNLGNTCYMNSVVQSLSYLPAILRFIEESDEPKLDFGEQNGEIGPNPVKIATSLYKIINILRYDGDLECGGSSSSNKTSSVYNPEEFCNLVRTFSNFESPNVQHDAHEFLVKVIDSQINSNDVHSYPVAANYTPQAKKFGTDIAKLFHDVFQGELIQATTCLSCKKLHTTTVPLQTLTVSIEPNKTIQTPNFSDEIPAHLLEDTYEIRRSYNLRKRGKSNAKPLEDVKVSEIEKTVSKRQRYNSSPSSISSHSSSRNETPVPLSLECLLDDFFKRENLDVYCENCFEEMKTIDTNDPRTPVYKVKKYEISRLSPVLIVHINRSKFETDGGGKGNLTRGSMLKDQTPVLIEAELDFKKYCKKTMMEKDRNLVTRYKLSAVIVHDGRSISSGHYRAFCLNHEKNQWLHINDSKVKTCSLEDMQRGENEPYLLFYSKMTEM